MSDEDRPFIVEKKWVQALHPEDPAVQVYVLATRVEALTKEKEKLEKSYAELATRVAKMEKTFNIGAGVLLVIPFIGTAIGAAVAYGKAILKPWTQQ